MLEGDANVLVPAPDEPVTAITGYLTDIRYSYKKVRVAEFVVVQ